MGNEECKEKATRERIYPAYEARHAARNAVRQSFCEEQGISLEQFEAVEAYLEDESEYW